MRQKNQWVLNLDDEAAGEARSAAVQATEARAARADIGSQAAGVGPSMEAIVERGNLRKALAQVKRNKGAAGIDGMSFEALGPYLKEHWPRSGLNCLMAATSRSRCGEWRIPKASGGKRPLGIPTVLD